MAPELWLRRQFLTPGIGRQQSNLTSQPVSKGKAHTQDGVWCVENVGRPLMKGACRQVHPCVLCVGTSGDLSVGMLASTLWFSSRSYV